jgi:hypothetical protein
MAAGCESLSSSGQCLHCLSTDNRGAPSGSSQTRGRVQGCREQGADWGECIGSGGASGARVHLCRGGNANLGSTGV